MLGPTCTLRSCLCAMTSLRNRARSVAYCSRVRRSERASFFTSNPRQSVSHPEQRQGMRGRGAVSQAAFDLMPRHRAIARVEVRPARLNALHDRLADLHGDVAKLALDPVGAIVAGTALDRLHRRTGNQLQHVAGLESDVLHPQMAGHVIRDLAEGARKIRAHQSGLMTQCQILEWIEY